jgi:uncharacterized protein (TIGR02145 family)
MAANLKTTHFRNGEPIAYPADGSEAWNSNTTGAYAWYLNNPSNKDLYGAYYNGYAVLNTNGLCPTGWHVPTDTEFTQLINFLGGTSIAGGKLKKTTGWRLPNTGATNEYGFSALGIGIRLSYFEYFNEKCWFWSSTELQVPDYDDLLYDIVFKYDSQGAYLHYDWFKTAGEPVRCLKD